MHEDEIVPGGGASDSMTTTVRITTAQGTHTLVWSSGDEVPTALTVLVGRVLRLSEAEVATPQIA